jgi:hypothetical protein
MSTENYNEIVSLPCAPLLPVVVGSREDNGNWSKVKIFHTVMNKNELHLFVIVGLNRIEYFVELVIVFERL